MGRGPRYPCAMFSRILRPGLITAACIACATLPPMMVCAHPAQAQQPALDAARARALFHEAVAIEAAGDYAGALSKFEQVAAFKNTPQVRFNIAVCQEKLGRWVVALGEYRIALADAQSGAGASPVVPEATRAIASLEPRIPRLTMTRGAGASAAQIVVDARSVADSQVGTALLLDPGRHTIEATAEGYQPLRKEIELAQFEGASVEIALQKTAPVAGPPPIASASSGTSAAPAASSAPKAAVSPQPLSSASTSPEPAASPSSHVVMKVFGWAALGIGVAGGITSGVYYARRASDISDLNTVCGPDRQNCPASAQATYDNGKRDTMICNIALGTGVVGLLTGVILLATSNGDSSTQPRKDARRSIKIDPWAGMGLGGAVSGSF
jgi:hypothetical protein